MKAIKFLLGLAFVFVVEQYSLSAAADEMFAMDDCGGSLKPDAEQAIFDSELMSDDRGKEKEEKGFAYFMVTRGSIIVPKSADGQSATKFIKPPSTGHGVSMKVRLFEDLSSSPKRNFRFEERQKQILEAQGRFSCFYTIDPRIIYRKARVLGINPPDACFIRVPFEQLKSEKLLYQPSVLQGTVCLMSVDKGIYREALEGAFNRYLKTVKVPEDQWATCFKRYFDYQFLEMSEVTEPSLVWLSHVMYSIEKKKTPDFFFGIDSYLTEELVDITGLEVTAWSDPLDE